jgi:cytosine/adenosine deaminase-related metal-dependent hydrolase
LKITETTAHSNEFIALQRDTGYEVEMRTSPSCISRWLFLLFLFIPAAVVAQSPARLIVKNARLFTMAPGQKDVFTGYLVVDAEGKLAAVAAGDPPANMSAQETWDAHGHWVLPGFLSAHSHLWQAAFRGIAADKTLPGWIDGLYNQKASKASPEDFYWFTLSGALDHLQHGITAAYDFNFGSSTWGKCGENACDQYGYKAEIDSSIRFVHGFQPDRISDTDTPAMAMARLKLFMDWIDAQPHSTRFLSVMLNGATAFNETYQQAVAEKAMMDQFHIGNQSHYLEPPDTVAAERAKFKWFEESGLLGPTLYFGHFIHADDAILKKVAAAHSGMSWNPLSNGRLASGVADIPTYLKMGIRVGMGVDGEASADLADPFENMRTGLYAIRDKYEDATIMSPYQVLYLHTMGSADVMGVKDKLGSLEPGKYADFLVVDPTRFGTVFDPYASLVLVTGERDLERVYVGGELKVDHGKMLGQDMVKVQTETDRRSAATMK